MSTRRNQRQSSTRWHTTRRARAAGILLLIASDLLSGPIQEKTRRRPWRSAESFFEFKVAWRAIGSKLLRQYLISLLILGVTALFAHNSELGGSLLSATGRFGGCIAIAVFLSSTAAKLAKNRPGWPWARSFPISSCRRVATDALFLGIHSVPLLIPVAFIDTSAMWIVLLTIPLLSLRAAGHMRRLREREPGQILCSRALEYLSRTSG